MTGNQILKRNLKCMVQYTDVCKEYANGTKALRVVDFTLKDGEFAFLVGPSGSGKSTMIKLITGEIATTSGSVLVNGYKIGDIKMRRPPSMSRSLGIIFQDC